MFVEEPSDLIGDDLNELSLEYLDRFVGGRDAAVAGEENLSDVAFPDLIATIGHIVDREGDVGVALVKRGAFVEREVIKFDIDHSRRFDGAAEVFEIIPILFIDPVVNFLRTDDVDVLDVGCQYFADTFANGAGSAGVAVFVGRGRTADHDHALSFERLAFGGHDVATLPEVNTSGKQRVDASGRRHDQCR